MFGDRCLGSTLALGDCASAPEFQITASGALRLDDGCVTSSESGELLLEACVASPEQYFVLDSEGALWNGRPPEPAADMRYDHVRCLVEGGALTCGTNLIAHWTFVQ